MITSLHDAQTDERQKVARALLDRGVLLAGDPLFALARRHKEQLAAAFRDRLGYSLHISTDTARLYKRLRIAEARPLTLAARTPSEAKKPVDERRVLDARRCLMVCLTAAVIERRSLWTQVPLTELADEVAKEARAVEIAVDWKLAADRNALIDGVAWLSGFGVLILRYGAEGVFGESIYEDSEAYYDINRSRLAGVLADPMLVATVHDASDLDPPSDPEPNRVRAQRLTRRLVEDPAVYLDDLSEEDQQYFLGQRSPLERRAAEIAGLQVERRREGSALIAAGRELSDRPFPARSHRKQLALLLIGELCELDAERRAGRLADECDRPVTLAHERVLDVVGSLMVRHRQHWGWLPENRDDVRAACGAVLTLLEELMLVRHSSDGVELRPAAFRYRSAVAQLPAQRSLFVDDQERCE
jgi:uncharacterized protein (TIGR02678 family)